MYRPLSLFAVTVLALVFSAGASAQGKITKVEYKKHLGTTVWLALDSAPFPSQGAPYTDNTVIVFVPKHYDLRRYEPPPKACQNRRKRRKLSACKKPKHATDVRAVVFFHGHKTTAYSAMRSHRLREQFRESRQNALLIVPQGPVSAKDSRGGKLSKRNGLNRMLKEIRSVLGHGRNRSQLGPAYIAPFREGRQLQQRRISKVILAAHSGGFQVAADIVRGKRGRHGGIEVSEVYLFDALYGGLRSFSRWVMGQRQTKTKRKLISFFVGKRPAKRNAELMQILDDKKFPWVLERKEGTISRGALINKPAVFINTVASHSSSSYRNNQFRDCLFASKNLLRHLPSRWFDGKNKARKIDRR